MAYQSRNATDFSLGAKDARAGRKPWAGWCKAYYNGYYAQLEQDEINGDSKSCTD